MVGVSVITKLEPFVVNELAGNTVTLNCEALVPVKKILPIFNVPVPLLLIEKVREGFVPKSVLFAVFVETPVGIKLPLPVKLILAVGWLVLV